MSSSSRGTERHGLTITRNSLSKMSGRTYTIGTIVDLGCPGTGKSRGILVSFSLFGFPFRPVLILHQSRFFPAEDTKVVESRRLLDTIIHVIVECAKVRFEPLSPPGRGWMGTDKEASQMLSFWKSATCLDIKIRPTVPLFVIPPLAFYAPNLQILEIQFSRPCVVMRLRGRRVYFDSPSRLHDFLRDTLRALLS